MARRDIAWWCGGARSHIIPHIIQTGTHMIETPQQYTARIVGILGGRDPRTVMEATPGRLHSLVNSATPDQLNWKPSPTRWSITQILAHLADAELVGAWRFRTVLERDGVALQAYNQETWAE